MQDTFNRELSEENVCGWDRGGLTELEKFSQHFSLKDFQRFHGRWSYGENRRTRKKWGEAAGSPEVYLQNKG